MERNDRADDGKQQNTKASLHGSCPLCLGAGRYGCGAFWVVATSAQIQAEPKLLDWGTPESAMASTLWGP